MPAFHAVHGLPVWMDVLSSDIRKSSYFYNQIFGWEIEENDTDPSWRMAKTQGLPVAGLVDKNVDHLTDMWVTYFFVDSLAEMTAKAEELGGRILIEPHATALGESAVVVDPSGALVGLHTPNDNEAFFAAGEPGCAVWHELSAVTNFKETIDFYAQLFDWVIDVQQDDNQQYAVVLEEGMPVCGIWDAAGMYSKQVTSFWQAYIGVLDVQETAKKVVELGGDILIEPFDSPFGSLMLVADSTGALVTICEAEPPVEEGHETDVFGDVDFASLGIDVDELNRRHNQ